MKHVLLALALLLAPGCVSQRAGLDEQTQETLRRAAHAAVVADARIDARVGPAFQKLAQRQQALAAEVAAIRSQLSPGGAQ